MFGSRHVSPRNAAALAFVCVALIVVAGCGSAETTTAAEATTTSGAPTTTAPTTAAAAADLRDATISVRRDPG